MKYGTLGKYTERVEIWYKAKISKDIKRSRRFSEYYMNLK